VRNLSGRGHLEILSIGKGKGNGKGKVVPLTGHEVP
jgi:hypothetical protein